MLVLIGDLYCFGDVTINPNQLQIKTGALRLMFPLTNSLHSLTLWYMLAFSYMMVKRIMYYVNGVLVADREIRTGPYGLIGFWIGGSNELIREVRFWEIAKNSPCKR
ncbi:LamG domain-containing protein [Bacteroides thetaiotaomicron]|uniref:LamG domain-containing protein n=1 Tax=Bacteroides thetaiotaomicron TaxID=818 RepID=UPI002166A392|nr:LamG domain-containing protein [Bacteroides thetaiotaomicron]MCS2850450.1 LamG domain-containing protein [Bacteroides thetaiotaomicron]